MFLFLQEIKCSDELVNSVFQNLFDSTLRLLLRDGPISTPSVSPSNRNPAVDTLLFGDKIIGNAVIPLQVL